MVLGRSVEGIVFSEQAAEPARLIFLLVTPAERPNLQVFLLAQLACVARSEFIRERLCRAHSRQELVEIIAAADPAGTGGRNEDAAQFFDREGDQPVRHTLNLEWAQSEDRWRDDGGAG